MLMCLLRVILISPWLSHLTDFPGCVQNSALNMLVAPNTHLFFFILAASSDHVAMMVDSEDIWLAVVKLALETKHYDRARELHFKSRGLADTAM